LNPRSPFRSEAIIRAERLMQNDGDLAEKVGVMEKNLLKGRKKKYL
jgi:hypothetical protein